MADRADRERQPNFTYKFQKPGKKH